MPVAQLKTLLAPALLPPVSLLLLALLGLLVALRWRRIGHSVIAVSLLTALALSLPIVSDRLMTWLEQPYLALDRPPQRVPVERLARARARPAQAPQAVVVLGGGTVIDGADSPAPNRLSSWSLERVVHARRVGRLSGLPLLVSGGVAARDGEPEAILMRNLLDSELSQPVRWVEMRSRDTAENARYSADILFGQGVRRIILVTHAFHMRRAQAMFEAEGFVVLPAPHDFLSSPIRLEAWEFIPKADSWNAARLAIREMAGLVWYRYSPWRSSIKQR